MRHGANRSVRPFNCVSSGSGAGFSVTKRCPQSATATGVSPFPRAESRARRPYAARRAGGRRGRRSSRDRGTGCGRRSGRSPPCSRVPRWRQTLKWPDSPPSLRRVTIRLSPATSRTTNSPGSKPPHCVPHRPTSTRRRVPVRARRERGRCSSGRGACACLSLAPFSAVFRYRTSGAAARNTSSSPR